MPRPSQSWTVYLALGISLIGMALALADRFSQSSRDNTEEIRVLRERVLVLETKQTFMHGEFTIPTKEQ